MTSHDVADMLRETEEWLQKLSVVRPGVKAYRRAYQALAEGNHGWHGTSAEAATKALHGQKLLGGPNDALRKRLFQEQGHALDSPPQVFAGYAVPAPQYARFDSRFSGDAVLQMPAGTVPSPGAGNSFDVRTLDGLRRANEGSGEVRYLHRPSEVLDDHLPGERFPDWVTVPGEYPVPRKSLMVAERLGLRRALRQPGDSQEYRKIPHPETGKIDGNGTAIYLDAEPRLQELQRRSGVRMIPPAEFLRAMTSVHGERRAALHSRFPDKLLTWEPSEGGVPLKYRVAAPGPAGAKLSEVTTDLHPQQRRVLDRMRRQNGLVVAHGLGSGKTLSSLAVAEDLGGDSTIMLPAALRDNYQKEVSKHVRDPRATYNIESLQRAASSGVVPPGDLLIVDEAHRLRDPSGKTRKVVGEAAPDFKKRLLLTATPLYNHPHDLASLVNLAAGENVLPAAKKDFEARYIRRDQVKPGWFARTFKGVKPGEVESLRNKGDLRRISRDWVDYHANNTQGFPARKDQRYEVPMSSTQTDVYRGLMDNASPALRHKIRKGLPPAKSEVEQLNAFLSGMRQVSNTPRPYVQGMTLEDELAAAPKIQAAYANLQKQLAANPDHRAVVYSNYLAAGLDPYARLLEQAGVPHARYTGEMSRAARDQVVRDYNEGKLRALLVSSAGGEGLDLKGTRQIQTLEPHWNDAKTDQVEGRAIRYGSHAHLPEDQRNVTVETYLSTLPERKGLKRLFLGKNRGMSADQYLVQMGERKSALIRQMEEIMAQGTADAEEQLRKSSSEQPPQQPRQMPLPAALLAGGLGGATYSGLEYAWADPSRRLQAAKTGAKLGALGGVGMAGTGWLVNNAWNRYANSPQKSSAPRYMREAQKIWKETGALPEWVARLSPRNTPNLHRRRLSPLSQGAEGKTQLALRGDGVDVAVTKIYHPGAEASAAAERVNLPAARAALREAPVRVPKLLSSDLGEGRRASVTMSFEPGNPPLPNGSTVGEVGEADAAKLRAAFRPLSHAGLSHADLHRGNLLIHPGLDPAIIDWSKVTDYSKGSPSRRFRQGELVFRKRLGDKRVAEAFDRIWDRRG